jgi:flagellar basal-body rod protein FlgF
MSNGIYPTLTRQSGLLREMDVIAQNIANASTTGYRSEGVVFAEHVSAGGRGERSLSMAHATGRETSFRQGALEPTGGTLDLAIEGEGYFLVGIDGAPHLTRAGAFVVGADGGLQTLEGNPVMDETAVPVFVPPGAAHIHVAPDGTLSSDGAPVARVAVVMPDDPDAMTRKSGTAFAAEAYTPVAEPSVAQGFLEGSNVDPVLEIARMVTVQNAYEMGQGFMDREHERMRSVFRLMEK